MSLCLPDEEKLPWSSRTPLGAPGMSEIPVRIATIPATFLKKFTYLSLAWANKKEKQKQKDGKDSNANRILMVQSGPALARPCSQANTCSAYSGKSPDTNLEPPTWVSLTECSISPLDHHLIPSYPFELSYTTLHTLNRHSTAKKNLLPGLSHLLCLSYS